MDIKRNENTAIADASSRNLLTFTQPQVMAVINLTPDSFYDGGRYSGIESVLRDAEEKVAQGADILDLGAASSRPGATEISEEEEWRRLAPVLPEIRKAFPSIPLSIDTYRSGIVRRCAEHGISLINDISGGQFDSAMLDTVAALQLPYVLMHIQGKPQNMQHNPVYEGGVVETVLNFFKTQSLRLQEKGFNKILLDPGFGFGKSLEDNYRLLKALPRFKELGFPILVGLSRKSMVNKVIGTNPVTALNGSTVLHTIALLYGASILRVHDVKEARQAIDLLLYYENA